MKPVEVKFDETAYKEYLELQKNVSLNKKSKKRPTYEQLLSSINNTIKNLKLKKFEGVPHPKGLTFS